MRHLLRPLVHGLRKRRNRRLGLKSRDPFVIMRELTRHPQPVIFDVGAHVGLAAARFRELFPTARVHCFEPYPESFRQLRDAVAGLGPVQLHNVALAAGDDQVEFSVNRNSATNSLLASDQRAELYWSGDTPSTESTLSVRTMALDAVAREQSIEHIDILKLDVQGGEYDVLLGARDLLARRAIGLIYMELITAPTYIGQHRLREYLELLDAVDYELFDIYNMGRAGGRLLQMDVIFTSPETLRRHEERIRERT